MLTYGFFMEGAVGLGTLFEVDFKSTGGSASPCIVSFRVRPPFELCSGTVTLMSRFYLSGELALNLMLVDCLFWADSTLDSKESSLGLRCFILLIA